MDPVSQMYAGKEQALVHYERTKNAVTLTMRGMTNHELRDVIVGLWLKLQPDDQADHIAALVHYLREGGVPSYVARKIGTSPDMPELRAAPTS